MKHQLSADQIKFYQTNGYIVIEDFLTPDELETWRKSVTNAVKERGGQKMPGKDVKTGEDDGINKEADYFAKVFFWVLENFQAYRTDIIGADELHHSINCRWRYQFPFIDPAADLRE